MCTFTGRETVERLFTDLPELVGGREAVVEEIMQLNIDWIEFTSQRIVETENQHVRQFKWPLSGVYGDLWYFTMVSARQSAALGQRYLQGQLDLVDRAPLDSVYSVVIGVALENSQTGAVHSCAKRFDDASGHYHFPQLVPIDENDMPRVDLMSKNLESKMSIYVRVEAMPQHTSRLTMRSDMCWTMERSSLGLQVSEYVEFAGAHWRLVFFDGLEDIPQLVLERDGFGEGQIDLQVEFFAAGKTQHRFETSGIYKPGDLKGWGEQELSNCSQLGFKVCSVSQRS